MVKILEINTNEKINEINLNLNVNTIDFIKKKNKIKSTELLYSWNIESNKIEVYGNIIDISNDEINKHKLLPCGISELISESSDEIEIFGNIYIVKYNNGNITDITIDDYGELYSVLSIDEHSINLNNEEYQEFKECETTNDNLETLSLKSDDITHCINSDMDLEIDNNEYI